MTKAKPQRGRAGIGTALARLARLPTRLGPLFTWFTRTHARLLRASRGRIRRSLVFAGGQTVLSLTTTGRRTGRVRSTVVAYMRSGDAYVVTAGNLGSEQNPAWFLNLMTDPHAEIEVDGRRTSVIARRATGEEARRLWRRWVDLLPPAETFREIAGREIPVVVLEPQE